MACRQISALFLVLLLGICLVSGFSLTIVQASTKVGGIIYSDTTWTKTNGPYEFTGPVGVSKGVTLTIEPGAVIKGQYLQVNGTLIAKGSLAEPIMFEANIEFMPTSSGITLERMILTGNIRCHDVSPTINNNTITGEIELRGGTPTISNNVITNINGGYAIRCDAYYPPNWLPGTQINASSPSILNNYIVVNYIAISCGDYGGGSARVSGNTVIGLGGDGDYAGSGIFTGEGQVTENIVSGFGIGVNGAAKAERNLIFNNYIGLIVGAKEVRHNTIVNNSIGLNVGRWVGETIEFNNIDNVEYNVYFEDFISDRWYNVTAMRNWWGSTDVRVIDAKVHGSWLGFDFFTVNYVPFLTVPDSLAPRWDVSGLPSGPYPSSLLVSPVLTPSVSPVLPDLGDSVGLGLSWVEFALGLLVGAVVVFLVVWVVFMRKRWTTR